MRSGPQWKIPLFISILKPFPWWIIFGSPQRSTIFNFWISYYLYAKSIQLSMKILSISLPLKKITKFPQPLMNTSSTTDEHLIILSLRVILSFNCNCNLMDFVFSWKWQNLIRPLRKVAYSHNMWWWQKQEQSILTFFFQCNMAEIIC